MVSIVVTLMLIGLVVIAFPKLLPQSEILNSDCFGENVYILAYTSSAQGRPSYDLLHIGVATIIENCSNVTEISATITFAWQQTSVILTVQLRGVRSAQPVALHKINVDILISIFYLDDTACINVIA